jgi:translocation and assembly module TamA
MYVPLAYAGVTVNITGVDDRLRTELLGVLALTRTGSLQHAETPASIRALYLRSVTEISDLLRAKGYYKHVLTDALRQEGDNWIADFSITPGPPVVINRLQLELAGEGQAEIVLNQTVRQFPLSVGMIFNHALYESGKRSLINIATDRGYLDAVYVAHRVEINAADNTAQIELRLDTGKRYLFGPIRIPDTVIERDILQRYIPFHDGAPYDASQLIVLGQNLRDSDYFEDAIVHASQEDAEDYRIPITVTLTPRPKNSLRVGAGYGSDSGPRLVGSWDSRYFNRRGHRVNTDLRLSTSASDITGSYVMPDFRNNGAELDLISSLSTETTDTSISDAFRFGVRQRRTFMGWNETASLIYQFESFKVADTGDDTRLLTPEISYWKSSSDSSFFARSGYRVNISLKGAAKGAFSDMTFLQTSVSGKYIRPAGERGRLITRGELGASHVPEFAELPASIRFFAGGDNSIRGFAVQQLGPRNADGDVIGGKYLTVGSIEYEYTLNPKWAVAAFSDFGNAYNDFSDHFVYSSGVGLRWMTPVGQLRIDVAAGLSEDDVPFRLHLNIGPDL